MDEDKRKLEQRQIGQIVLQHLAEEKKQARGESELLLAGIAANGAVQQADKSESRERQDDGGEGEQQPLRHGERLQTAVERLQGDRILADEHPARFQNRGQALRQRGKLTTEAVLFSEFILGELRVLAVGDVAVHLQTHHIVIQQDFQPLELRFHRLPPRRHRLRHRAALPFVQLELLADDVLAVIELRLQRVETLQHRAKLGADAVDALQRQRGQIRKLQLLQAPLQRQ